MKKLITFGCSWTLGIGVNWHHGMSKSDYDQLPINSLDDSNYDHSFRLNLANKFNLKNVNFAMGAHSNQYNLRKAREFFTSLTDFADCIVLWGVTSTARNEYYDLENKQYQRIKFDSMASHSNKGATSNKQATEFFLRTYSHNNEVKVLAEELIVWNTFFKYHKIPVIFFDTFNTHKYPVQIENMISTDLLTLMLEAVNVNIGTNKLYHYSSWHNDDPRISAGVKEGLLNQFSYHPTRKGHELITEILSPYIEENIKRDESI